MQSKNDVCEVCKYCVANMDNKQLTYICKRYPPVPSVIVVPGQMGQPGMMVVSNRPQVILHDTCGEFTLAPVKVALIS